MNSTWHLKISNKNRKKIVEAGKSLLFKSNFLNVRIKDVCSLAGVSRVTFYKYFKDINEFALEIKLNTMSRILQFVKDKSDCIGNGKESVRTLIYAWLDFAGEYKEDMKFSSLFDIYYSSWDLNEEIKSKSLILEMQNISLLKNALDKGIKDGSLKKNLDSSKTSIYIYQIIMGLSQRVACDKFCVENNHITFDKIFKNAANMIISFIENK